MMNLFFFFFCIDHLILALDVNDNVLKTRLLLVITYCLMATLFWFSSVYNACGLASYDLFDDIDFDLWFTNQLLHELNNPSSRYVNLTSAWKTGLSLVV